MTLKECYHILELGEGALLSEVKHAYRRLAFSLHPDLNPDVPDASHRFHLLNEAYVLLSQALSPSASGEPKASEQTARAREEAQKAYQKAQRGHAGTGTQEKPPPSPEQKKEELLKDILNDPFARRVFEDIYSHIREEVRPRTAGATQGAAPPASARRKDAAARTESLPAFSGIKSWLRRQIDDEQVLKLPRDQIVPGARVRLQIRHGLSGEPQTIELTLPPEFSPGKAMRLKGMGRRLGKWRGDLFVRIESS